MSSSARASPSRDDSFVPRKAPKIIPEVVLTLDCSLIPSDRLNKTPSAKDGLSSEDEKDLRILGCELIQSAGILLRLPQVAMATGQVLFQRFYYSDSMVTHDMEVTSMACIALASKIEEAPRRFRDVINVFHHLKQLRTGQKVEAMPLHLPYINLKNSVIKAERRILKQLGFCVHVKHPHKFVVTLLQVLGLAEDPNLMQSSWNYMNDCLRSDLFVRHTPETIACSCIYLSARVLRVPLPPDWYDVFDIPEQDIIDVCKRILGIYARAKPDQLRLEQVVEEVRAANSSSSKHNKNVKNPTSSNTEGQPFSPKKNAPQESANDSSQSSSKSKLVSHVVVTKLNSVQGS